jgi:preprotein translocase SecE subunit
VARNRKRAKERRARRQPAPSVTRARLAEGHAEEPTPDPIEHAAPDVELAEAQLSVGRPEPDEEPITEEELTAEEELEAEADPGAVDPEAQEVGAEVARSRTAAPAHRGGVFGRLVGFLQGSWRELQRVQWPDRRQVAQATGVVIGFVIVAGLYLAAADGLASKLMDYILK